MKTHEQIVSEWAPDHDTLITTTQDALFDLCRRVAEEQREQDQKIAAKWSMAAEFAIRAAAIRQQETPR